MNYFKVGAAIAATIVLLGISYGSADASVPPPRPAPTAAEFAVGPATSTLHAGQKVPIQRNEKAWALEAARLAAAGHASAIGIDTATGTILFVTDLGVAASGSMRSDPSSFFATTTQR
jgi:hypothetical protein